MQREFFFLYRLSIFHTYIDIYIVELIQNRVYVALHETQFGGWGMVGRTLSNEIFKSDNPTEPPSHEPSFHSVISSLPRSGYPGGRGKYRVRRAPDWSAQPDLKGISKTLRTSLPSRRSSTDVSLSQQVRMDLLFLPLFFLFFFWGNEESRTTGGWLAFVHWKSVVEKFATVIDGEHHNRMKDDITGLNIFLYLIYYGGVR